jgi:hypothetical protein
MASFTSILSDIGNGLKKFFTGAVAVATAAEPFVDTLFPGVANLYNAVLAEVGKAEAAAVAAGAQNGTGAQKLALVVQAIVAQFPQYTPAQLTIIINGVVAGLNAIPAATATATTPAPTAAPPVA